MAAGSTLRIAGETAAAVAEGAPGFALVAACVVEKAD